MQLLANGKQQFIDSAGLPLANGQVYFYAPGTTTPATTYQDSAGLIPNTNPVVLDSNGQAVIWGNGTYRQVVLNASSVQVWDQIAATPDLNAPLTTLAGASGAALIGYGTTNLGALFGSHVGYVGASIAALRALDKSKYGQAVITGYYASGDGGGGPYYYDSTDTTSADNAGTIIVAADGGRWKLVETKFVSVKQFGAKGDGTTDDSTALSNAKTYAQAHNGTLFFPVGTYIVSSASALQFTTGEVLLTGEGFGTVIKAANAAALNYVVSYSGTGTFRVENLTIDGNKTNTGTLFNNAYLLYLAGAHAKIRNVEMRNSIFAGAFMGSTSVSPSDIEFDGCWFHDNGGIATNGNGCGLYGGGTFSARDVRVLNCRFENNYNQVTTCGLSNAINVIAKGVSVIGSYFKNNLNNNGGQIDIGDGGTGASDSQIVVQGNTIEQTTTFASDVTCGIEIIGRKVICSDNLIITASADGIRVESSAGDALVSNNMITCSAAAINLINSGGTGIVNSSIRGNQIFSGATGIQVQSGAVNIVLENNYLGGSVTTKLTGLANCLLVRNNFGINPLLSTISAPAVAASATVVTNNTHADCDVYVNASASGSVTVAIGGTPVTTLVANATGVFYVGVGSNITLTYTAAPTWVWLGK